jgi:PAS domain S-box-containing protein
MATSNEGAEVDAAIASGAACTALYEHSGVAIAFFSIGGRFLRVNAALCRMLGYSEEELLQKTHLDVVHVDDMEATAIARAQVISGKTRARITERRYVHKDGSTVWAHAAGAVVRDAT